MSSPYFWVAFCFLAGPIVSLPASAATNEVVPYECQIEAKQGENFDYAAVELWAPGGVREVRGILCLVLHPLGHGGSKLARPEPWIELANRQNCALMAVSFAQSDDLTRDWCRADQGTGRALFAALDVLAGKSRIPSLSTASIAAIGVCAAGQFAYHLAAFDPTRIAAFVTIGGGKHDLSKIKSAAKTQALLVVTPDRGAAAVQNLDALYLGGQSHSAPWLRTSENISNYDAGLCSSLVISYLQTRLDNLGAPSQFIAVDKIRIDGLPNYLPISICGEKLPPLGIVEPSEIALGTIDSLAPGPTTFSFDVVGTPNSTADDIFVPVQDSVISTDIQVVKTGCWRVTCRLDRNKLSLGPLNLEVPIRYLLKGNKILGGTTTSLTGFVTGAVECVPRSLNLGVLETGKTLETKICLFSNNRSSLKISAIRSTLPWIEATPHTNADGTIELWCSVNPSVELRSKGFSGYLQIQIESPTHRLLKVFCYGSVN